MHNLVNPWSKSKSMVEVNSPCWPNSSSAAHWFVESFHNSRSHEDPYLTRRVSRNSLSSCVSNVRKTLTNSPSRPTDSPSSCRNLFRQSSSDSPSWLCNSSSPFSLFSIQTILNYYKAPYCRSSFPRHVHHVMLQTSRACKALKA